MANENHEAQTMKDVSHTAPNEVQGMFERGVEQNDDE